MDRMDSSPKVDGLHTTEQNQPVTAETPSPEKACSKRLNRDISKQDALPTKGLKSDSGRKPKKNFFRSILAKAKPIKKTSFSATQITAVATEEGKLLSSDRFYLVSGVKSHPGKHLKALGKELDRFNAEVCSEFSPLSPFEKTMRTMELREKTEAFLERKEQETTRLFKRKGQAQQRIAATKALIKQLDTFLARQPDGDRRTYSKELCDTLCDDIKRNGSKLLLKLSHKPETMEKLIAKMELRDLHRFAEAHGENPGITDPEYIKAMTRACWNVVKDLSSEQMVEQYKLFHQDRQTTFHAIKQSGNSEDDRRTEFTEVMRNLLNSYTGTDEVSTAIYQCYQDGLLTINMLDEWPEGKAVALMMDMSCSQQAVDTEIAGLDYDLVTSLHASRTIPTLEVNVDDNGEQILTLGKLIALQGLFKADQSGDKNSEYSNFVRTWDQLRYQVIPDYNQYRQQDGLVDMNPTLSRELTRITPKFVSEIDAASKDSREVEAILKRTGWQKAPDSFEFKQQIKQARRGGNTDQVKKLEQLAAQDCLYRYFEQRGLVNIPARKPE